MILVITGNGKGKTTSALGTAIRAVGWGNRVAVVFFDKGGNHYGEQNILNLLQDKIDFYRFGLERFDEETGVFRFRNTEADKKEAKYGIEKVLSLYEGKYFLIIADELIACLNNGLVTDADVRDLVNRCPEETHLLLTGRNAPDWLIKEADMVSDVKEVKHYFEEKGTLAVKGLDY